VSPSCITPLGCSGRGERQVCCRDANLNAHQLRASGTKGLERFSCSPAASHRDETPEEALWLAFYNATPPDDLDHELTSVVIIVDSDSLEATCIARVEENNE
jgi:hypothetical protein